MSEVLSILSVGLGTLLAIVVFEHCRIVQANGATAALNMLYPYPKQKSAPLAGQGRPTAGAAPVPAGAQLTAATHVAAE